MVKELFNKFVEQITFDTEFGLSIEIEDFFKDNKSINKYEIEITSDKKYKILVKLENYSLQEAKSVFHSFLHFIEYSASSFYTRENSESFIQYSLISLRADKTGFFCHIIFSN